ncbi:glycine betaine/L-proline ABC transporter substrate-binding protein ProX [Roseofilum casamattae]|uniref:Glycine betaine/L-proline ABC transporter substrate-binding protein ProX n=1 Tax=Roseofilum casamattae BLCC-M143 TaxID=3022442 RepID=A0ABT7BSE7_9CYAN|nr:glycine betaine/L-proline ABC transporter substrate-binding protein ProX [Roseofilum casamattae]MDJ1182113.1 glycine betaine/L-proline ABC transporter substrate-binding protein ProX [Roseofilum casamattae BLCC-M143]
MKTKHFQKCILISTFISLLVGLSACQTESNQSPPLPEVTIRSAHSSWVEESFQTQVVNLGLEQLGYQVEPVKELEYPALYLSIANNDIDYSVVYYRPGHEEFFNNVGGEEKLEGVGVLIAVGTQGYRIDKKTADKHGITNIEQLKDPEIAKLFDFDGDGKANLTGCNPGWTCEKAINHHIEAYGLQDRVEQDQGNYTALLTDAIARYEAGEPILYYAYKPHWIFAILKPNQDTIWLEVPYTDLPENLSDITTEETTFDGKNLGLPAASQTLVVNKEFAANNPVAKRWFELVQIPVDDMNAASLRIKDGENTPEDMRLMAEEWAIENQAQFYGWIEEAKAAGK